MAPFDLPAFARRRRYPLAAGSLIACGVALRLALILAGWPHSNSEEGTMGLEAMHILLRGERPIYFYGQNYMGAGEAYLGALAFQFFGVSLVALRLGMVALYALFMVGVGWLAHLLYGRRVALISLAVLVLGTPFLLQIELLADGGKAETMALGALMFALATWLALRRDDAPTRGQRMRHVWRYAALVAWGVCAGLGLYTYAIVAPFVLASGLLLGLARWRDLRRGAWALPLAGLLIGLAPAILYTAAAPLTNNPVAVFLSLHQSLNHGGASGLLLLLKQVVGTLLYTLPMATGLGDLYPVEALPLYGPLTPATFTALLIGGGWSLGYLALLGVATYRPLRALRQGWRIRRTRGMEKAENGDSQKRARDLARLALALAAWLTLAAYLFSATAANNPHSGRYMIGLLIVVPAVLWPLFGQRAPDATSAAAGVWRFARPVAATALIGLALLLGVVGMARAVPMGVAQTQTDAWYARNLLSHHLTRFYSDYWTCDLMNFATREQVICAVVGENGQPGLTRYSPYLAAVRADPNAPYLLRRGSDVERTFMMHAAATGQRYQVAYSVGSYTVYVAE